MSYPLHIIHPVGATDLTPGEFMAKIKELQGVVLGIKLHPAFIIYMMTKYKFNVINLVKEYDFLVMIDDKSHDIKEETKKFVQMYEGAGADILTVHASGGPQMLADAVRAASKMQIFGVTLLTSLKDWECEKVYVTDPEITVIRLMRLVEEANCHGSVCAPRDLRWLTRARIQLNARVRLCPGIRDPDIPVANDDQNPNRSLTPYEAGKSGVELMVVGRWIEASRDPRGTAETIESAFRAGVEDS